MQPPEPERVQETGEPMGEPAPPLIYELRLRRSWKAGKKPKTLFHASAILQVQNQPGISWTGNRLIKYGYNHQFWCWNPSLHVD